ncbi:hypothetical protein [Polyangium fumosum]|uniref:Uncharacterized protein n=1 Tax=Polyangium fumosum TaxID=889272 RepID=A0A4U1IMI3_9BACT|nr:hypothetical protein [Polyangium fumosum]TKC95272.1 hypothetical protein E8A74_46940 [Polyangium fumosum]
MATPIDPEKAYEKHLPAAQALQPGDVLPFRLDLDLALANVTTGMRVAAMHEPHIPVHLPKVDLAALLALPELAVATKFAALRAEQEAPGESLLQAKLSTAARLRAQLLSSAKALASNGTIPQAEVDAIIAGRGARDRAEDCISLADLFRRHAQTITGKHPVTAAQIDEAAEIGAFLVTHLKPADAPKAAPAAPTLAVDIRNRLATLLVREHARLQAVAHYFHPDDWEELAPPLGARSVKRQKPVEP